MTRHLHSGSFPFEHWARWCRAHRTGLGYAADTTVYRAIMGKFDEFTTIDAIDADRRVQALPPKLRQVLVAEYVLGGIPRARYAAVGMSRSAYYRALDRAHAALSAVG